MRAHRYIGKVCCLLLVRAHFIRPRPRARPRGHGELLKLSSCSNYTLVHARSSLLISGIPSALTRRRPGLPVLHLCRLLMLHQRSESHLAGTSSLYWQFGEIRTQEPFLSTRIKRADRDGGRGQFKLVTFKILGSTVPRPGQPGAVFFSATTNQ